jgi:hypothetical protein
MATEPLLAVLLLRQLGFPPWQYGLAFVRPGLVGLATVMAVELAIIISMSLYNSIAIFTALGGLLADATSPRTAITAAGLAILASPLLLPRQAQRQPNPMADTAVVNAP